MRRLIWWWAAHCLSEETAVLRKAKLAEGSSWSVFHLLRSWLGFQQLVQPQWTKLSLAEPCLERGKKKFSWIQGNNFSRSRCQLPASWIAFPFLLCSSVLCLWVCKQAECKVSPPVLRTIALWPTAQYYLVIFLRHFPSSFFPEQGKWYAIVHMYIHTHLYIGIFWHYNMKYSCGEFFHYFPSSSWNFLDVFFWLALCR